MVAEKDQQFNIFCLLDPTFYNHWYPTKPLHLAQPIALPGCMLQRFSSASTAGTSFATPFHLLQLAAFPILRTFLLQRRIGLPGPIHDYPGAMDKQPQVTH